MSKKSAKIVALIESCRHADFDPHYVAYFECFNSGMFYEAHDVLEELWLSQRYGPNYGFYKGLIQFAGAFVHLQKHCERYPRLKPAAALFKLARTNLQQYPGIYQNLDVANVLSFIEVWLAKLAQSDYAENPLGPEGAPKIILNRNQS